ncbi:MAG: hypothetical protein JSV00_03125, partial [bacterium]
MRPSRKPFTWPSPETLAILLAAVLLSTFMAPRAANPEKLPEPSRLKAVQILILPGPDETGARLHLRKLRDAGFDTIILRAFHLAGDRPHPQAASAVTAATEGVYFPTGRAPVVMDLVTPFVRICREEGLRPFAWMVTRRARFGNPNLSRDRVYSGTGDPIVPTEELDILDPASRDYLAGLFQDLAATGVEGILLQDEL